MERKELIKKHIDFFKSKNHKVVPSSSLVPENDSTTLFISAGMQPLVPFFLGQKHPLGKRIVNVQKCIRTGDIEEVGDSTHHTFFEMLGNWSLGDYWKKEAIGMTLKFFTKELKIPLERIAVTCFKGDKRSEKDIESAKIWKSLGIKKERIAFLGDDNWWGPAGKTGPCGPSTEIFYWKSKKKKAPKDFNPEDSNWVEIGNDVLIQYNKDEKGKYTELKQKIIDFGGGVERTITVLNDLEDDYLSDSFKPIIEKIEERVPEKFERDISKYEVCNESIKNSMRIIADHIKASVFIMAEGITPSNAEQGYVLRRLIRRAIRHGKRLKLKGSINEIAGPVFGIYEDYTELGKNKKRILDELEKEENKFKKTLEKGIRESQKMRNRLMHKGSRKLRGKETFLLYQSYGFPIEMIQEEFSQWDIKINEKEFLKEQEKHQSLSRTAAKGKFKAGLADNSKKTTQYHTATHLLHKALKEVLGGNVEQRGSNITQERIRFDFSFDRKLTEGERKKVEGKVNTQIKKRIPVECEEMPYEKAAKSGAESFFKDRYPKIVKVYTIGDFSKEICTGPHVKNTKELGKFKIIKEESSSSGVRRIKAVLE
jgi:alanyl-tRNA synthetase